MKFYFFIILLQQYVCKHIYNNININLKLFIYNCFPHETKYRLTFRTSVNRSVFLSVSAPRINTSSINKQSSIVYEHVLIPVSVCAEVKPNK